MSFFSKKGTSVDTYANEKALGPGGAAAYFVQVVEAYAIASKEHIAPEFEEQATFRRHFKTLEGIVRRL